MLCSVNETVEVIMVDSHDGHKFDRNQYSSTQNIEYSQYLKLCNEELLVELINQLYMIITPTTLNRPFVVLTCGTYATLSF